MSDADRPTDLAQYLRAKVKQLLAVVGTAPLQPELLDDQQLVALDPIGILAESFRQVIAQLHASHRRLQAVLDAAQEVAIICTDADGCITVFNRGAENMLGYLAQDVLGASPLMFHSAGEVRQRTAALERRLGRPLSGYDVFTAQLGQGDSHAQNWTYLRRDHTAITVSLVVSQLCDEQGQPCGYLGIARDISDQLAAESSLRQLNLELDRRVQDRTAALLRSTDQLQSTLNELRHTQNQLVQSEKLAALGAIVAGVAHELNTPIGNCITVASTLQEDTQRYEREFADGTLRRSQLQTYMTTAREALDLLLRGLHRVADQVTNFKQVAVDQSGAQRRPFELHQIVANLVALMNATLRKTPYRLTVEIPPGIKMHSYPGAIEQIVSNLINNSVLHGFDGREQGEMRLQATLLGDTVEIVYTDNGCGMSETVKSHVFDPFFTTRLGKGGSGLGMHICYNLATGPLGGSLEVDSAPGQGCRFTMVLPLEVAAA